MADDLGYSVLPKESGLDPVSQTGELEDVLLMTALPAASETGDMVIN